MRQTPPPSPSLPGRPPRSAQGISSPRHSPSTTSHAASSASGPCTEAWDVSHPMSPCFSLPSTKYSVLPDDLHHLCLGSRQRQRHHIGVQGTLRNILCNLNSPRKTDLDRESPRRHSNRSVTALLRGRERSATSWEARPCVMRPPSAGPAGCAPSSAHGVGITGSPVNLNMRESLCLNGDGQLELSIRRMSWLTAGERSPVYAVPEAQPSGPWALIFRSLLLCPLCRHDAQRGNILVGVVGPSCLVSRAAAGDRVRESVLSPQSLHALWVSVSGGRSSSWGCPPPRAPRQGSSSDQPARAAYSRAVDCRNSEGGHQ